MWYNPEDVLNDLARYTGKKQRNLDRNYVVVGQNPPPPARYMEVDDDEFTVRFGYEAKAIQDNGSVQPDLRGIKEMLKMVGEQDNGDEDDFVESNIKPGTNIIISKLNPNVEEFVPKSVKTVPKLKEKNTTKPIDEVSKNNSDKVSDVGTNKSVNERSIRTNEESGSGDPSSQDRGSIVSKNSALSEEEIKSKAESLKRTICNRGDTYKAKREKNLAITSLLKLYTENPSVVNSVKLMTPDDFCTPKTEDKPAIPDLKENSPDPKENSNVNTHDTIKESIRTKVVVPSEKPEKPVTIVNRERQEEIERDNIDIENDPQVKTSIEKVMNWLEPKECKKKETRCPISFGPLVYVRKESTKSPSTAVKPKNPIADQSYKPSKYAEDLAKKYENQLRIQKEKVMNNPTWDNLQEVLQMKDEEIRKQRSATASNSSSSVNIAQNGSSETV